MLPEKIIFFAVTLNLIGHIFYIRSIIKGQARPNLVSWVIWAIASFLGVFFELKAGAGLSVLPIFIAAFGSSIISLAAILSKNALWKIKVFDIYCGALSVLALVLYIYTHNLGISILFAILSDLLAFVPTYVKAWKFPETEMWAPYLLPIFSNTVGLLIIKNWFFTIYSFGLYFVVANSIMIIILYRKKITSIFS